MLFQFIGIVLGILGLCLHYSGNTFETIFIFGSLIVFILIDLIGLATGQLKIGIGLFIPIVPIFFIKPWYVGFLFGFVIISLIEAIPSVITKFFR